MRVRVPAVLGACLGLVLLGAILPLVLRHISFFRVRQIELVGVTHHSPDRLLNALEIDPDRNLFDPLPEIEKKASRLPGVVSAKAKRRMPGTLTIEVEERVPVAFVPTASGLLAVDANANPLSYDPTETGLDLPIVPRADSLLARVLARLRSADSVLYQRVDAARFGGDDGVVLELGPKRVVLRRDPTIDEIRAVALVRRHLALSGRTYDELDVRFDGRVIVRGSGA